MLFDERFVEALLALMEIDTVTPMEGGSATEHERANLAYLALAESIGMRAVFTGAGRLPDHPDANIPVMIERRMASRTDFLACQPHLELEIGNSAAENTLMFNFHMDTVSPHLPCGMHNGVLSGRGAVDNKGPGIALLAALDHVRKQRPAIFESTRILMVGLELCGLVKNASA